MNRKNIFVPALSILLMAAVLLGVSAGLSDLRATNIQKEHLYMMQTVLPGSTEFTLEPYTGEDTNILSVHKAENGFVIETATQGYADEIIMMIGVSNAGTVTGLVVRDMNETPGLGARALSDADFLAQFLNTSGNVSIAANADAVSFATSSDDSAPADTTVDAISGATVTSKAIARSINSAVAVVTGADAVSSATTWGG